MKALIGALAVLILMIGAPLAYANQADTEKEAGIARDAQGGICDFGLHHDECPNTSNTMPPGSKADDGEDVSGFTILPPGQHYAGCEEDIHRELGCDVVNDTSSP